MLHILTSCNLFYFMPVTSCNLAYFMPVTSCTCLKLQEIVLTEKQYILIFSLNPAWEVSDQQFHIIGISRNKKIRRVTLHYQILLRR